jgi:hypothetical protein
MGSHRLKFYLGSIPLQGVQRAWQMVSDKLTEYNDKLMPLGWRVQQNGKAGVFSTLFCDTLK